MDVRVGCEESWAPKNWCFWTAVFEKTLESRLDCKEIQPVHSEGNQPWDLFGRNDAKTETSVLWPPHAKSWLTGKDSDAGRDWGRRKRVRQRGWDAWMASLTRWTWVWVKSRSCWWTGKPGVLRFMGLQGVGHGWATELNWIILTSKVSACLMINLYRKQKFRSVHLCWIFTEEEKHMLNKQSKLGIQPYLWLGKKCPVREKGAIWYSFDWQYIHTYIE